MSLISLFHYQQLQKIPAKQAQKLQKARLPLWVVVSQDTT